MDAKTHWEKVYATKTPETVSWYRPHLETSVALIERAATGYSTSIIDVGGGESTLVDDLLARSYENITVLDVSQTAIDVTKKRLGLAAEQVHWLVADVTDAQLERGAYDVWHDRAVFHFLTASEHRAAYVRQVAHAVKPGGHVIVSTFGPEGPTRCSGLDVIRYDAESLHDQFGVRFRLVESSKELHRRSNDQNHMEHPMTAATSSAFPDVSRRVLQLQVLTIVWMTVEAAVSLGAGLEFA